MIGGRETAIRRFAVIIPFQASLNRRTAGLCHADMKIAGSGHVDLSKYSRTTAFGGELDEAAPKAFRSLGGSKRRAKSTS